MSEKVLGFYEKDARFPLQTCKYAHIEKDKLIPVNLKSESVTIEWLKQWIKDYIENEPIEEAWINATELLSATKKHSEK